MDAAEKQQAGQIALLVGAGVAGLGGLLLALRKSAAMQIQPYTLPSNLGNAFGTLGAPMLPETRQRLAELRKALAAVKAGRYCKPLYCRVTRRDGRKGKCPQGFRTKTDAVKELLDENPRLSAWLQSLGEPSYRAWVRNGRAGPKPMPGQREVGLDAFDIRWDLRGRNQVGTWVEALYRTLPSSRRWRDLPERLAFFEEQVTSAGLRANVVAPEALARLLLTDQAVEFCKKHTPKIKALAARLTRAKASVKRDAKKARANADLPF